MSALLNPDTQAVRDYVTAVDHLQFSNLAEGTISVMVTHSNLRAEMIELKLDLHHTVAEVKSKLRTHIGTSPEFQILLLKHHGNVVCEMNDDSKQMGYYSVESGMEIHVIDNDPHSLSRNGGLEDVSQIQKYRMTEEEYDQREGTLRDYARKKREEDPNFKFFPKDNQGGGPLGKEEEEEIPGEESVEGMNIGDRCEVAPGGRRGVVQYIGTIPEIAEGWFVGVKFDEPVGRGDGTVRDRVLIDNCPPGYGGFIRARKVEVGDFPERDLFEDDEDSEDEEL